MTDSPGTLVPAGLAEAKGDQVMHPCSRMLPSVIGDPVAKISKLMKRSEGAIRQEALAFDISIGHRR